MHSNFTVLPFKHEVEGSSPSCEALYVGDGQVVKTVAYRIICFAKNIDSKFISWEPAADVGSNPARLPNLKINKGAYSNLKCKLKSLINVLVINDVFFGLHYGALNVNKLQRHAQQFYAKVKKHFQCFMVRIQQTCLGF